MRRGVGMRAVWPVWVVRHQCHGVTKPESWPGPKRCRKPAHFLLPELPFCQDHLPVQHLPSLLVRLERWEELTKYAFHELTGVDPDDVSYLVTEEDELRWSNADRDRQASQQKRRAKWFAESEERSRRDQAQRRRRQWAAPFVAAAGLTETPPEDDDLPADPAEWLASLGEL